MFNIKLRQNKFFIKEKLRATGSYILSHITGVVNFFSKKRNFKLSVLSILTFSLLLIIGFLSYSVYLIFNFTDSQKNLMYSLKPSSVIYYNSSGKFIDGFHPYISGGFQHNVFFTFFIIAAGLSFIIISLMFLYFYKLIIRHDDLELSLNSIEKNALEVPALIFHEIKNSVNALSINSKLLNYKLNNLEFNHDKHIKNNNNNNAVVRFGDSFKDNSETTKSTFIKIGSMIESETDKINLMMDNIIKFSKSFKPDFDYVCLDSLILECINDIDLTYINNVIKLNSNIDKNITVKMDKHLMKQVFFNLISNAIHSYNGMQGSVNIYTSYYFSKAVITIEDNGAGISKNNLKKVFEPFFTTRENGIGLGLAFVKKVLDSHGFAINIDTEQGKGTKVSIILGCVIN
jgi:signal transduction histidine kinase